MEHRRSGFYELKNEYIIKLLLSDGYEKSKYSEEWKQAFFHKSPIREPIFLSTKIDAFTPDDYEIDGKINEKSMLRSHVLKKANMQYEQFQTAYVQHDPEYKNYLSKKTPE